MPAINHRNKHIGPFYVVCRSGFRWYVEYEGEVLYQNVYRYKAIEKAEKLHKKYIELFN